MWQEFSYYGPGGSRPYYVYTPDTYQVGTPVPLLVMLHGCTQKPEDLAHGTHMNGLAEAHNFIVLYPKQLKSHNGMLCWNWFQHSNQTHGTGEPALIAGIVQEVAQHTEQWTIDPARIYVAGISAGAAMAVILGATYPYLFAALGIHSGVEYRAASNRLNALLTMRRGGPDPAHHGQLAYQSMGHSPHVIPTIVFQGTRDRVVAPTNGEQVVQQWMVTNSLASNGIYTPDFRSPASIITGQVPGGYAYTVFTWKDNTGHDIQAYWLVEGLGHAWSGGHPPAAYTDPRGPDASQAMYDFFIQHPAHVTEEHKASLSFWEHLRNFISRG